MPLVEEQKEEWEVERAGARNHNSGSNNDNNNDDDHHPEEINSIFTIAPLSSYNYTGTNF